MKFPEIRSRHTKAKEYAVESVKSIKDQIEDQRRNAPSPADVPETLKYWAELAELEAKLKATEGAVAFCAEKLAKTQRDADEARKDEAHAAVQRDVAAAKKKLIPRIGALATELAATLRQIDELRTRVDMANAVRGDRPFIVDAERQLREYAQTGRPAITEKRKFFEDPATGKRYGNDQYHDASGRVRKREGLIQVEDDVVIIGALPDVRVMPPRLADGIKLVDMAGKQIWPPL